MTPYVMYVYKSLDNKCHHFVFFTSRYRNDAVIYFSNSRPTDRLT